MKRELQKKIFSAAEDLRYFFNRGYPRERSLELVGNHYNLIKNYRNFLRRGIFSDKEALDRKKKLIPIEKIRGKALAIDGYNVLITVESALQEKPLVQGDDYLIRDIAGISGSHKITEVSFQAIDIILRVLKEYESKHNLFYFVSSISKSGILAAVIRDELKKNNLSGNSESVRFPAKVLSGHKGVIATSNSVLIDQVERVVDLAGYIAENRVKTESIIYLHEECTSK